MAFSGRLILFLVAAIGLTTVAAPFIFWAVSAIVGPERFSFPRVYDRVLQIIVAIGFSESRRNRLRWLYAIR